MYYVGKCKVCGDKYLSNSTATQCGNRVAHETAGHGRKQLTTDKKVTSANGEKYGDPKK